MAAKSYKREVGFSILVLAFSIVIKVFWFEEDPEKFTGILSGTIMFLIPVGMAPFGYDAYLNKKGKE